MTEEDDAPIAWAHPAANFPNAPRAPYKIGLKQEGCWLVVSSPRHEQCTARFHVNEIPSETHFSPRACEDFKERVLEIWGPGGRRSVVPLGDNGKPQDTFGWLPIDGKLGEPFNPGGPGQEEP